jgi:hypothetical protein
MKHASIGSISHGTLRTVDLLETFTEELAYHMQRNFKLLPFDEYARLVKLTEEARNVDVDADTQDAAADADEIITELQDALNAFAPPYCYFGAPEGDGSDFGFWPCHDQIDELPRVKDPNEVPDGGTGEDCVFVNDHGNVTVYGADGTVILELV